MFKDELIVIRHARSLHNANKTENLNSDLTPWGENQADHVGKFLSEKINFNGFKFFTSPFKRCLETSFLINRHIKQKFIVDPIWREYLNHSRQSVTITPDLFHGGEFNWDGYQECVTFDEEFNETFINRIQNGFDKLPEKSLVVTHGLPALQLIHVATGRSQSVPIWDYSLDNCSITYIVKGRVVWHGRNVHAEGNYKHDKNFYRPTEELVNSSTE